MRVRQWAVLGVATIGVLAGGVGTAQATEDTGLPDCGTTLLGADDGTGQPAPCGSVEANTSAEVGCSGPGVLDVYVTGLEAGDEVQLIANPGEPSGTFPVDEDGSIELVTTFEPDTDVVAYEVQHADGETVYRDIEDVENTCRGAGTLTVTGDCADPETLQLDLVVTGLEADTEYEVDYQSDGFTLNPGYSGNAIFFDTFTTDAQGAATVQTAATEDEAVSISDGAFTIDFAVFGIESYTTSVEGSGQAEECTTAPVVTTPAAPAAPTAALVVVHPAAAAPAVLANTGTPVTAAALLGGGLLVAGAGVLVAGRRRAS